MFLVVASLFGVLPLLAAVGTGGGGSIVGGRTRQPQDDRQQEQPVEQAKYHHQEEDLEEGGEHVGVAGDKQNEGDEGGDSAVEDGGANVHQGGGGSLSPAAAHCEKGVAYVGGVVHAQAWTVVVALKIRHDSKS
jgi:hypothetical protein